PQTALERRQSSDSPARSPVRAGPMRIGLSAFPEGTVEILRERLDQIGKRRAFTRADEYFDGHSGNDGMSVEFGKFAGAEDDLGAVICRLRRLVGQRVGGDARDLAE